MELIIKPKKSFSIDFNELNHYRGLFYVLAWRDLKVRYKQTVIGILWAVLQPFIMMVVFSIFFGRIAGMASEGVPYPIFAYIGLLYWNYFSNALSNASNSLIANQAMTQKVYFPRIILPMSGAIVFLADFFFAFLILIGMMVYYKFTPTLIGVLLIVPLLIISSLAFSGLGLLFAAINVKYRDVRHALPFFIQLLIFVTPVIYSTSALGKYEWLLFFNPMSGVISAARASFLGVGSVSWGLLGFSFVLSIVWFVVGLVYFNKTEKHFADII